MSELRKNPVIGLVIVLLLLLIIATGSAFYLITTQNKEKENVVNFVTSIPNNTLQESQITSSDYYDKAKEAYDNYETSVASRKTDLKEEDYPVATIKVKGVGTLKYRLDPNQAPQSTQNFIELANKGFYDGLVFHRIEPDFVAQGGDPDGTGTGGPGYSIVGEFPNNGYSYNEIQYELGTLAFARNGAAQDANPGDFTTQNYDSAGSQFFITLTEDKDKLAALQNNYAPFGQIIEGQNLLSKFKKHNTTKDANDTLKITSITVDTKGQSYDAPIKLTDNA